MACIFVNPDFPMSPEALMAGDKASALYVKSFAYCSRHKLGPHLPKVAVETVLLTAEGRAEDLPARLVASGLWTDEGETYRLSEKFCRFGRGRR